MLALEIFTLDIYSRFPVFFKINTGVETRFSIKSIDDWNNFVDVCNNYFKINHHSVWVSYDYLDNHGNLLPKEMLYEVISETFITTGIMPLTFFIEIVNNHINRK